MIHDGYHFFMEEAGILAYMQNASDGEKGYSFHVFCFC